MAIACRSSTRRPLPASKTCTASGAQTRLARVPRAVPWRPGTRTISVWVPIRAVTMVSAPR